MGTVEAANERNPTVPFLTSRLIACTENKFLSTESNDFIQVSYVVAFFTLIGDNQYLFFTNGDISIKKILKYN